MRSSSSSATAADVSAGKTLFKQQCSVCHTAEPNDNGGAQGPNLNGVFGRHSASTDFSYTPAMKKSGLTWDAATLDRFLTSPTTVVPGWASPSEDLYRLPRLRVLGGTSPAALLQQIAQAQSSGTPPGSYGGAGTT